MYLSSVYLLASFLLSSSLQVSLPSSLPLCLSSFLSSVSPVCLSMCLSSIYQLSNLSTYLPVICLSIINRWTYLFRSDCGACIWGVYSASLPRDSQSPAPITNLLTLVAFILCISFLPHLSLFLIPPDKLLSFKSLAHGLLWKSKVRGPITAFFFFLRLAWETLERTLSVLYHLDFWDSTMWSEFKSVQENLSA